MAKTNTIITIGREYGSAGRQIGYKVAEDLGIKLYDREMLERKKAASAKNFSRHMMKNLRTVSCIHWLWILILLDILHPAIRTCQSIIRFSLHSLTRSARLPLRVHVSWSVVVLTTRWKNLTTYLAYSSTQIWTPEFAELQESTI